MARSDNTAPRRIQEAEGKSFGFRGGDYRGLGREATIANRAGRRRARLLLVTGRGEPDGRTRHQVKHFFY